MGIGFGEGSKVEKGRGGGEFPSGCWGWYGFVISVTLILALVRCGCSRIPNGGRMRLLRLKRFLKVGNTNWVIAWVLRVRKNADGKGKPDLSTT